MITKQEFRIKIVSQKRPILAKGVLHAIMVKVNHVETKEDYVLLVRLSNGKKGFFNVKPYLDKGIFTELKDKSFFNSVRLAFGGVVWPHEQDFSADTIEYEMQQI